MDPPEHRTYRGVLNPYMSPAAIKRWEPFIDEVVRASIDEKIESGRMDFVDDLANVTPAVITLAMLGIPLKDWPIYSGRRTPWCTRRRIRRKWPGSSNEISRWRWPCWPMSLRFAITRVRGSSTGC